MTQKFTGLTCNAVIDPSLGPYDHLKYNIISTASYRDQTFNTLPMKITSRNGAAAGRAAAAAAPEHMKIKII
ncbi:unnamed protein product [Trichogramma brassicae]|uniref:Uncharacterized protein n=1 Tax=Trichogramma brassicae TaxID=86971 RepID=A0A6H5I0P8_9HYME|nr:unnamed protein product [Trichogramma brassicae]